VGKKPPQSQKGGSHGLTPRMSAGLSPTEPKKKRKRKRFLLFLVVLLGAGGPAELREVACNQKKIIIIIKKFIYLFIYFCALGLSPADVRGVKPWEPPF
jgi:hypothetical protein